MGIIGITILVVLIVLVLIGDGFFGDGRIVLAGILFWLILLECGIVTWFDIDTDSDDVPILMVTPVVLWILILFRCRKNYKKWERESKEYTDYLEKNDPDPKGIKRGIEGIE